MLPRCEVILEDDAPCGDSPSVFIKGICVHEHIEECWACAQCRASSLSCNECFKAGCACCPSIWRVVEQTEPVVE